MADNENQDAVIMLIAGFDAMLSKKTTWPKKQLPLTEEQVRISEDWYAYWLNTQVNSFSGIMEFGDRYVLRTARSDIKTLEIGVGIGNHLKYENLDDQIYVAQEIRPSLAQVVNKRFPEVVVDIGDCQVGFTYEDHVFDRILAVHLLEHLTNLPKTLDEVRRVLRQDGTFSVVIPCEGGLMYALGRYFTTQRMFEKRYKTSYRWWIEHDHVNTAREIIAELKTRFVVLHSSYYPLRIPSIDLNLVVGLTLKPRN